MLAKSMTKNKDVKFKFELTAREQKFLNHFPGTLYTYLPDHNDEKPVIHSELLDLKRQEEGYGIFFSVNGFFGGKRSSGNLKSINAFFCDIDFPDKINRNEETIREYKNDLTIELIESGIIPSAIVETKNGLHVYWFLETPIKVNELNPDQLEKIKITYTKIEEAILAKFDGDPVAKDIARVLRIPGTMHQKNPSDLFECGLIHYCKENVYTFKEISQAFLTKPAPDSWAESNVENAINPDVQKSIETNYPKLTRPSYIKLLEGKEIPDGMRNKALLIVAHAVKDAGWSMEKAFKHFDGYAGLPLREVRKTIRSAYEHSYDFGYNNEVMQEMVEPQERKKLSEITSKALSKDTKDERDSSNYKQKTLYQTYEMIMAERFPTLKYKSKSTFYIYNEGLYSSITVEDVRSMFLREMIKDGLVNYRKVSAVNDKIACFKSLEGRTFTDEEENPNPNILNLKNGLLDISTYTLYTHTPNYLSTTQVPFSYNPDARCPRWLQFLIEVTGNDADQMKLLQQIAGYCLTTDTRHQVAFIFTGLGGNGKGTFTKVLEQLVGKKNTANASLDTLNDKYGIGGIVGKRLNIIDEISGRHFESTIIKKLIAADQMDIQVKYIPELLSFTPVCKVLFNVNSLPRINDTTPALYRRFIIVPFNTSFIGNADISLNHTLSQELTGILNWAIMGLQSLRTDGYFNQSKKNFIAMQNFKSENSPLVEFLSEMYQPIPEGEEGKYSMKLKDVYETYKQYCFNGGYKPKSISSFTKEISYVSTDGWKINLEIANKKKVIVGIRTNFNINGDEITYPDQQIN